MDSFEGIQEFVAVAEQQGFSAAARQLGCSTSHISRQVARLETRLGVALVARTTRLVSLTDAGTLYYHQCRDLVDGLLQANEQVSAQHYQLSGILRVSAAGAFAENHVAPALINFACQHPQLSVKINFDSRLINFVEEGYDFAIRLGQLKDSSLVARKLVDRRLMAAASPAYLSQYGSPQHPEDLRQHSCIINNDNWTFQHKGRASSIRVQGRFQSNNPATLLRACEQGLGIVYLPRSNLIEAIQRGALIPVLEPFWHSGVSNWIVYQNRKFLPMRARLAIDYLLTEFAGWVE
ncbi:MAG: LysR family transcriptional regulator [Marinobacterium sp.]|nr:LysR family transcriptional regulator [Marinobacterium sp.]